MVEATWKCETAFKEADAVVPGAADGIMSHYIHCCPENDTRATVSHELEVM